MIQSGIDHTIHICCCEWIEIWKLYPMNIDIDLDFGFFSVILQCVSIYDFLAFHFANCHFVIAFCSIDFSRLSTIEFYCVFFSVFVSNCQFCLCLQIKNVIFPWKQIIAKNTFRLIHQLKNQEIWTRSMFELLCFVANKYRYRNDFTVGAIGISAMYNATIIDIWNT